MSLRCGDRSAQSFLLVGILVFAIGLIGVPKSQAGATSPIHEASSGKQNLDAPPLNEILTTAIAQGVHQVAQGEPAFESQKEPLEVIAPNPASPASYGNDIRNFHRAESKGRWLFMVSMPGWLPGMEGEVTAAGIPSKVDLGVDDMLDVLEDYFDYGAMLNIEARRGRWLLFSDLLYLELSGDFAAGATLPPLIQGGPGILERDGLSIDVEGDFKMTQVIAEFGGGYRFLDHPWGGSDSQKRISMDIIGGARYWRIESSLNVNLDVELGPISRSAGIGGEVSKDWVDPFVGLRTQIDITEKLFLALRGDIGGFDIGSGATSRFSWKAQGALYYSVTRRFAMFGGYQVLDVDYEDGGFGFDMRMAGPVLGFSYAFGGPSTETN